jgi:putative ABC transport system permease protein
MEWLPATWLRVKALFRRVDRDLEDELAFHLAMKEAKNRAADVPESEAQAAARKQFGNVTRIKEVCREMRTFISLETFWQDLRYGARGLRKDWGLTLVAVMTLAVGIGASSWVFAMLKQWVIEAVAFSHPEQLVVLWAIDTKKGLWGTVSAPDYLDWNQDNHVLESLSAWSSSEFNMNSADAPQRVHGGRITASFLHALDVQPEIGRDFLESDVQPGASRVVIVSHGLWRDHFNGDRDLTNKTLTLEGEPYAVVGVMPEDFHYTLMGRTNLWVPLILTDKERADRGTGWLQVIGRLKPGVTEASASEAMNVVARNLERAYPETNTNSGILVKSLSKEIGRHVGDQGVVTGFVVGICILLIACSNIAGIYIARTLARRKEMTMRLALGARRSRLARQLLSENTLLLPAAIVLGLFLAKAGASWVTSAIPYENRGYLPNYGRIYVDSATLIYAVVVAGLSVLLFSLAPILEGYKLNLTGVLKETSGNQGASGHRLRKTLVVAEIVLALTALVPAGLMVKSFSKLLREDPGFRTDHVLTTRLSLPVTQYKDKVQWQTFYDRLLDRLRSLPQVQAASAGQYIPFGHHNATLELWIEGKPEPAPGQVPYTEINAVYPGYLSAMGLSLLRGRFLSEQDRVDSLPVIVINRTVERRYFAHEDALGHRIRLSRSDSTWYTVVGVVKDVKLFDLGDAPENQSYLAFSQSPKRTMSLVLRTSADPMSFSPALRNAVSELDKELPISNAETMEELIGNEEAPFRIFAQFALYFALVALFLAGMGIYGIMAYLVESRSREIGIRMACGAERRNIFWLVLAGSLKLVATGVLLGLAGSRALAQLLSGLLHGVSANDPFTYAISVAVLVLAILLASLVPVRRATKVDPMLVLRCE